MADDFPIETDSFLMTLPVYTFIGPAGPGLLRNPEHGTFAPIWTDWDLFRTYIEGTQKPQVVNVLEIHTVGEFKAYLNLLPPEVATMILDASPVPNHANTFQPLEGIRFEETD